MYIKHFKKMNSYVGMAMVVHLILLLKFDVNLWLQATALASALRPAVSYTVMAPICVNAHTQLQIYRRVSAEVALRVILNIGLTVMRGYCPLLLVQHFRLYLRLQFLFNPIYAIIIHCMLPLAIK